MFAIPIEYSPASQRWELLWSLPLRTPGCTNSQAVRRRRSIIWYAAGCQFCQITSNYLLVAYVGPTFLVLILLGCSILFILSGLLYTRIIQLTKRKAVLCRLVKSNYILTTLLFDKMDRTEHTVRSTLESTYWAYML